MNQSRNLRQGMEVYGSDNQRIGTIDSLDGTNFEVTGRHLTKSAIGRIDGNRVYLTGPSAQYRMASDSKTEGDIRVPIREERLEVDKRAGQIGEVEINKSVSEERKSIPVELSREEVHVEQRNIPDRPLREGERGGAFEEGTIRVPIRGEEAVVSKDTVVGGEVVVDKDRKTEHQEITDTVRKEHVDVDQNAARRTDMRGADVKARPRDLTGRSTVAGLFQTREQAERAINDLKNAGFNGDQIGIMMRDRNAQGEMVEETGSHAAEGATAGIIGGGLLGGLAGFLAGIGALAIPGVGPVIAGGILATTLAGAGIGAVAGGIAGALIGMGIPEDEAKHFETGVREGRTLVTVRSKDRLAEAMSILERNGADTGAAAR